MFLLEKDKPYKAPVKDTISQNKKNLMSYLDNILFAIIDHYFVIFLLA
jgi:hypothetical protein